MAFWMDGEMIQSVMLLNPSSQWWTYGRGRDYLIAEHDRLMNALDIAMPVQVGQSGIMSCILMIRLRIHGLDALQPMWTSCWEPVKDWMISCARNYSFYNQCMWYFHFAFNENRKAGGLCRMMRFSRCMEYWYHLFSLHFILSVHRLRFIRYGLR